MFSWKQNRRIVVTCAKGVSLYLTGEVSRLGYPIETEMDAAVVTEGTLEDSMRLNLCLRTGHRVLFAIDDFRARDADELYGRLVMMPWEQAIRPDDYITLTSTVDNETIKDNRFVNVRGKDAIVDRIRKKCGRRPDSGPDRERVVVHLYWKNESVSVYLDTSGEPLSKRGYRKNPVHAPMQETLAAAVIIATGWDGSGSLINPMCGSGTLAIEAALMAIGKAPGLTRKNFGFMHLKGYDHAVWKTLVAGMQSAARPEFQGQIIATDISHKAVLSARKNARAAGVEGLIRFEVGDYAKTPIPEGGGIVIVNPEYGRRLGEEEQLVGVYKGIGDFFKQKCRGYRGFIFTGNLDLAKKVGLRTKKRELFYNGDIECRLLEYDLYEGSRKQG